MSEAKKWLIWSAEHAAWWGPGRSGYTKSYAQAGRYTLDEAIGICCQDNYWWTMRRPEDDLRAPNETMVQEA